MARGTLVLLALVVLANLSLCDKSTENLPQSESLVSMPDESKNEAENPQPPFWTKPERMERRIYAEPLHKTVRIIARIIKLHH